jgi:hypothetical protein
MSSPIKPGMPISTPLSMNEYNQLKESLESDSCFSINSRTVALAKRFIDSQGKIDNKEPEDAAQTIENITKKVEEGMQWNFIRKTASYLWNLAKGSSPHQLLNALSNENIIYMLDNITDRANQLEHTSGVSKDGKDTLTTITKIINGIRSDAIKSNSIKELANPKWKTEETQKLYNSCINHMTRLKQAIKAIPSVSMTELVHSLAHSRFNMTWSKKHEIKNFNTRRMIEATQVLAQSIVDFVKDYGKTETHRPSDPKFKKNFDADRKALNKRLEIFKKEIPKMDALNDSQRKIASDNIEYLETVLNEIDINDENMYTDTYFKLKTIDPDNKKSRFTTPHPLRENFTAYSDIKEPEPKKSWMPSMPSLFKGRGRGDSIDSYDSDNETGGSYFKAAGRAIKNTVGRFYSTREGSGNVINNNQVPNYEDGYREVGTHEVRNHSDDSFHSGNNFHTDDSNIGSTRGHSRHNHRIDSHHTTQNKGSHTEGYYSFGRKHSVFGDDTESTNHTNGDPSSATSHSATPHSKKSNLTENRNNPTIDTHIHGKSKNKKTVIGEPKNKDISNNNNNNNISNNNNNNIISTNDSNNNVDEETF